MLQNRTTELHGTSAATDSHSVHAPERTERWEQHRLLTLPSLARASSAIHTRRPIMNVPRHIINSVHQQMAYLHSNTPSDQDQGFDYYLRGSTRICHCGICCGANACQTFNKFLTITDSALMLSNDQQQNAAEELSIFSCLRTA